jgi:hypothetical protein
MHVNAFMCLGNEIKHTISHAELPLEVLDIKPWEKHGYKIFVELPNGDLCKVTEVHDGIVEFVNEVTQESGCLPLNTIQ